MPAKRKPPTWTVRGSFTYHTGDSMVLATFGTRAIAEETARVYARSGAYRIVVVHDPKGRIVLELAERKRYSIGHNPDCRAFDNPWVLFMWTDQSDRVTTVPLMSIAALRKEVRSLRFHGYRRDRGIPLVRNVMPR